MTFSKRKLQSVNIPKSKRMADDSDGRNVDSIITHRTPDTVVIHFKTTFLWTWTANKCYRISCTQKHTTRLDLIWLTYASSLHRSLLFPSSSVLRWRLHLLPAATKTCLQWLSSVQENISFSDLFHIIVEQTAYIKIQLHKFNKIIKENRNSSVKFNIWRHKYLLQPTRNLHHF